VTVPDLLVQHQHVDCVVLGGGPAADRAVRSALASDWPERLGDALAVAAPRGYWLVRSLTVGRRLSADWTSTDVATELAQAVVGALADKTRMTSDPEVMWFPDRAAFLARLVLDLAGRRSHGRWEYAGLPDRLVDLARTEPDDLAAALGTLTAGELREVAAWIDPAGERSLLLHYRASDDPGRLLAAWERAPRPDLPSGGAGTALVLAVTAAADAAGLAAVAGPALDVADLLDACRGGARPALVAHVVAGRWAEAAELSAPDAVLPLVSWARDDRARLAAVFAAPRAQGPGPADRAWTPYGGCFVLLGVLHDLWSWSEATATWPDVDGAPAERVARLLTVRAVLRHGTREPLEDPLVRRALGCEVDPAVLADCPAALNEDHVRAFEAAAGPRLPAGPDADLFERAALASLAALGRSLAGMASASPEHLWHNVLDVPAWVTDEDERVVVELGHPPLGVLLSLAGLDRGVLDVPGGVPWVLTRAS
jgi:hypothetical protein